MQWTHSLHLSMKNECVSGGDIQMRMPCVCMRARYLCISLCMCVSVCAYTTDCFWASQTTILLIRNNAETNGDSLEKVRSQKFKKVILQLKYSLGLPCLLSHAWQMTLCYCWSNFNLSQHTPPKSLWLWRQICLLWQTNLSKTRCDWNQQVSNMHLKCTCQILNS